jgi:hypothetical protein
MSSPGFKRNRQYRGGRLNQQGWRLIIGLAERMFGAPTSVEGNVDTEDGDWGYSTTEDFLAEVNIENSNVWLYFDNASLYIRAFTHTPLAWQLKATKAQIVSFERDADEIVSKNWLPDPPLEQRPIPESEAEKLIIFIGHGRSTDWRDLKDHLQDKHGIQVEAYETGSREGHARALFECRFCGCSIHAV